MSIRRVLVLAFAVAVVAVGCEGFDVPSLQYTVAIDDYTDSDVVDLVTVTVLTADGQSTFRLDHREHRDVTGYLGGHFSVVVHPYRQTQISDIKHQRDTLEAQLLTTDDPEKAAVLESYVQNLNAGIQEEYKIEASSRSCTANFPESRLAIVYVMDKDSEAWVSCGPQNGG